MAALFSYYLEHYVEKNSSCIPAGSSINLLRQMYLADRIANSFEVKECMIKIDGSGVLIGFEVAGGLFAENESSFYNLIRQSKQVTFECIAGESIRITLLFDGFVGKTLPTLCETFRPDGEPIEQKEEFSPGEREFWAGVDAFMKDYSNRPHVNNDEKIRKVYELAETLKEEFGQENVSVKINSPWEGFGCIDVSGESIWFPDTEQLAQMIADGNVFCVEPHTDGTVLASISFSDLVSYEEEDE